MQIKILGSAAGGGFPQWNCACSNCAGLRQGTLRAQARTQSQVAVSADGATWFLLNASPDLRQQIEATPALQPAAETRGASPAERLRHTPIGGVLLTNADLDHVLGLLLLREAQALRIYATAAVQTLLRDNSMFQMLERQPQPPQWVGLEPGARVVLRAVDGRDSGLECRVLSLSGDFPLYAPEERRGTLSAGEAVIGLVIGPPRGPALVYLPGVAALTPELRAECDRAALLLFDGTFWSEDELPRLRGGGRGARAMGHLPISGPGGSLAALAGCGAGQRAYIHLNNTNPLLDQDSAEHAAVRAAGWEIASDGMTWNLSMGI